MPAHPLPSLTLLLALILAGTSASAAPANPEQGRREQPEKERKAPPPVSLDDLYKRLKESDDEAESKAIATLIERRLGRSGSATADLLSDRARQAMAGNELALAVELMDRAVALEPDWAEGWSRRATLFWRLSDSASAIADLQRALVLEPRHFEAWAALGKLYLAADDKGRAMDAFRRAEALYPRWDVLKKAIDRLRPEVDGRDL
ncbi:tetratricopeptide repeat protein [Methylorubrum sp. POS3]|uniref:tetratricopeptide repeat protein n=1 Tax=Methylorubrum sp. POS3 TaxID=2998492 RepID=UPI003729EB1F